VSVLRKVGGRDGGLWVMFLKTRHHTRKLGRGALGWSKKEGVRVPKGGLGGSPGKRRGAPTEEGTWKK